MNEIKLNDILKIDNLDNVKVRFNLMFKQNWNPIEIFKNGEISTMLEGQYWNYSKMKSYKEGQITIGLVKIKPNEDFWLLFHIGKVTKDLNILNGIGYEYETIPEFEKYIGRLVIRYKNKAQTLVRKAESVFEDCYISQILPDTFDNDIFPGYEKVNISWNDLKRIVNKETWKTALQNQKGVYLITDISNGNGGNIGLKSLSFEYIKKNFRYSILDIYKSTTDDAVILERESWWKNILQTRNYGYNEN